MAVNSVAMLTLGTAGSTAGWIPLNYPLLIVKKGRGSTHVMFEAQTQGGGGGPLYRGYYNKNATYGNKWTGWAKIATATPPQEYDLSLADGISGTAKYCKTQEGVVLIHGWVQNLAKPEQGKLSIIATLRLPMSLCLLGPSSELLRRSVFGLESGDGYIPTFCAIPLPPMLSMREWISR